MNLAGSFETCRHDDGMSAFTNWQEVRIQEQEHGGSGSPRSLAVLLLDDLADAGVQVGGECLVLAPAARSGACSTAEQQAAQLTVDCSVAPRALRNSLPTVSRLKDSIVGIVHRGQTHSVKSCPRRCLACR